MTNVTELTPSQCLDYCKAKLRKIPYSIDTEIEIGIPIKEVIMLLEKLQEALLPKRKEETEQEEI